MTRAPRRPSKRSFYTQGLTEAERADFAAALQAEGLDEEVAALRLLVRKAYLKYGEDLPLVLRGMDLLRRMVATKYGLSKADQEALNTAFAEESLRRVRERGGDHDAA